MTISRKEIAFWLALTLVLASFSVVLYRTAWLCDDAYITFRTVDNFVNGYGLRWNVIERVQAYTHPLWFFVLSFVYLCTREIYYSSIYLSMAITMAAVTLFAFGSGRDYLKSLVLILGLLFSRAFVDYSSSGLENPLSHLLLVLFMIIYNRDCQRFTTLTILSFVAALGVLNRMDTALLYFSCLIFVSVNHRSRRVTGAIALGLTPVLVWLLFSLAYYGFLFPNTAYAKLGAGAERFDLAVQGMRYLQNSMTRDPLTLIISLLGIGSALYTRKMRHMVPAIGSVLYLLYVVQIGGDFMSGRFLTIPVLMGAILLQQYPHRIHSGVCLAIAAAFCLAGISTANPTVTSGATYGSTYENILDPYLVSDERAFYFQNTGLFSEKARGKGNIHPAAGYGKSFRLRGRQQVVEHDTVGIFGFYAGPEVYIIDLYALGDPLLSRLPMIYAPMWRVGHFRRHVPNGYFDTLESGEMRFSDEQLTEYYAGLKKITRDPLWSLSRWKTILLFNCGVYDSLIDADLYRFPGLKYVDAPMVDDSNSGDSGQELSLEIPENGLHIELDTLSFSPTMILDADGGRYYVVFMNNKKVVAVAPPVPASVFEFQGFEKGSLIIDVPESAKRQGYTGVRLLPMDKGEEYSLRRFLLAG